jgi:hypothetical protein
MAGWLMTQVEESRPENDKVRIRIRQESLLNGKNGKVRSTG